MKRIAFISHVLPGITNGQSIVLSRLLGDLTTAEYIFISSTIRRLDQKESNEYNKLHSPRNLTSGRSPWLLRRLRRMGLFHNWVFSTAVKHRARVIARAVIKNRCSVLVACSGGDLIDIPAAVEAGRLTKLPVFLYYFDDYPGQWEALGTGWQPAFANHQRVAVEHSLEPFISGIIVPNEMLEEEVTQRLSRPVPVVVVRNPVDLSDYEQLVQRKRDAKCSKSPQSEKRNRIILYTGSVYNAQADSLNNIIQAIQQLVKDGYHIALKIYSNEADQLNHYPRLYKNVTVHDPVSPNKIAELQSSADVLLLPLSFYSDYPSLIRTSAPGKFGEYLAAGTPMFIHAPRDSFPVVFANTHRCAQVCDTPDVSSVCKALASLLDCPNTSSNLVENALRVSQMYDIEYNRNRFFSFLDQSASTFSYSSR